MQEVIIDITKNKFSVEIYKIRNLLNIVSFISLLFFSFIAIFFNNEKTANTLYYSFLLTTIAFIISIFCTIYLFLKLKSGKIIINESEILISEDNDETKIKELIIFLNFDEKELNSIANNSNSIKLRNIGNLVSFVGQNNKTIYKEIDISVDNFNELFTGKFQGVVFKSNFKERPLLMYSPETIIKGLFYTFQF